MEYTEKEKSKLKEMRVSAGIYRVSPQRDTRVWVNFNKTSPLQI